jgi:guanylate cyclase
MKKHFLYKAFGGISNIGSLPGDSEEVKLQKSQLVICGIPFIIAGAGWGLMYYFFGEKLAALIPLSYSFFSISSIIYFGISRRFWFFRFSQLVLILLLPFSLMIALGGFVNGSSVILWSLLSPLGALLFDKQSNAHRWLIAYVTLVVITGIAMPWLRFQNQLAAWQINLFFAINLIAVGSLIFLMVYYFVSKKNYFQARSEALLLNILPKAIADELKTNGKAEAKQFDQVTVMFTDFKNFAGISEKLSPNELVAEIDSLFRAFDRIISRHNIEKIKTIGDSYMCAGGLPVTNNTHAFDVVSASLEILQFMLQHLNERKKEGWEPFEIRIGVHTGPVVAGIVGEKKFAYDIWGDTVNLASRMESSGEAGKVNISCSTYELVKDKFNCIYRGKIKAKSKGDTDMYFVEGAKIGDAVIPGQEVEAAGK